MTSRICSKVLEPFLFCATKVTIDCLFWKICSKFLFHLSYHNFSPVQSFFGCLHFIDVSFFHWLILLMIIRIHYLRLLRTFFHLSPIYLLSLPFIFEIIAIWILALPCTISLIFRDLDIRSFWTAYLTLTFFAHTIRMTNLEVVGPDV